jgi:hypothetical protein
VEGQPWRQKAGQALAIELAFIGTDALAKSMAEIIPGFCRIVTARRQILRGVGDRGRKQGVGNLLGAVALATKSRASAGD